MAITRITSRDFNQNKNSAKKTAGEGPVVITERGAPAHVLMTYADYQRLAAAKTTVAEALAMPMGADVDIEFPKLSDTPREIDLL